LRAIAPKLLCSSPELGLEPEQLCALNGTQELRKLALLRLKQVKALSLDLYRLIQKLPDARLVCRVSREYLLAHLTSHFALTRNESVSAPEKLRICRLQPGHLSVVELESLPDDIASALIEALLELGPALSFLCSIRLLRTSGRSCHRHSECA
jgi:hypothetical protein